MRHLRAPVRFGDGVATLLTRAQVVLEVGPGTTLSTLIRQTDGSARTISTLGHPLEAIPEATALATAAGELWLAGAEPHFIF